MRILVVAPGHGFSTLDVFSGVVAGLRACGQEVFEYPLHKTFETMELLVAAAKELGIAPEGGYPDPLQLGTMGIPGYAMAKRVELVLFIHGLNVPPSIPETLRRGGYKTAILCTESPYETAAKEAGAAMFYDVVFTTDRAAPPLFTFNRPDRVHYLAHAWHPERHCADGAKADPCDVFFVGTRYPERDELLSGVCWDGIDFRDRTLDYTKQDLPDLMGQITPNEVTAAHYRSAAISLNHHRTSMLLHDDDTSHIPPGFAESLNPRAYEVPACGGFLVSDARAELSDIFGDTVPTYTDSASLEQLIRHFLAHPDERQALAARQHACVQSHSWTHRARQLLDHIAA